MISGVREEYVLGEIESFGDDGNDAVEARDGRIQVYTLHTSWFAGVCSSYQFAELIWHTAQSSKDPKCISESVKACHSSKYSKTPLEISLSCTTLPRCHKLKDKQLGV